ncbi:Hypothetical predicted protein [Cloeon dipterum]|uniref:Uncharacterized protein n=1 Tax=Cloeon dipterum TaxID=197152 RepID=A0A8S1CVB2_9INSE|nr:Hypothetical predicted protein [Cloeon dipterum]
MPARENTNEIKFCRVKIKMFITENESQVKLTLKLKMLISGAVLIKVYLHTKMFCILDFDLTLGAKKLAFRQWIYTHNEKHAARNLISAGAQITC